MNISSLPIYLKPTLLKLAIIFIFLFNIVISVNGQATLGISDTHAAPDSSAMLDVNSTSKGVLVPRVSLTSTTDATTIKTPATSLLVYNTSAVSDVEPGYYYWNGSKWVHILTAGRRTVTKTTSTTLTKAETQVYTYGNVNLTMPSITPADDDLEISIKNKGAKTDLLQVSPYAGSSIDSQTQPYSHVSMQGRTYRAHNGKWYIKEKMNSEGNTYDISPTGSFTTIEQAVSFLNSNMTGPVILRLNGGDFHISSTITINLPYPVTLRGESYSMSNIIADASLSGSPMFICQSECYFKMLTFTGVGLSSGNDGIRFSGSNKYHEIKDCNFFYFNKGIVQTNNNELWIYENDFEECFEAGIEVSAGTASGGILKVSEVDFIGCGKGLSLYSAVSEAVKIINAGFYCNTGQTGIYYNPAGFTTISSAFFTGNVWNNIGTFYSGFDFARQDGRDANIIVTNNAGTADTRPKCFIHVDNNVRATTVINTGTYYKAVWFNTDSVPYKFQVNGNRITYLPSYPRNGFLLLTGNAIISGVNNNATVSIVKNGNSGTVYGQLMLKNSSGGQIIPFALTVPFTNLAQNDYLEVWCTANKNNVLVTFQDIQWYTDTH